MLPSLFVARCWGSLLLVTLGFAVITSAQQGNSTTRTYYVAAVEEDWDYMPREAALAGENGP